MQLVICPGIHPPELTDRFLAALKDYADRAIVIPGDRFPVYSPRHVISFVRSALDGRSSASPTKTPTPALLWIGFSAGVVGAIGAARAWQNQGYPVLALIAIDGWGVPLIADFPIHTLSHDRFTHWSSHVLNPRLTDRGQDHFIAVPSVGHLTLWQAPAQVTGQRIFGGWSDPMPRLSPAHAEITAADFIVDLMQRY